ncbi:hypothetical protein MHH52_03625 [Paenibacillus sp. FSL K6-0276]|uniref:hypothetical protein n=1 Tax=Paenibacillus sp. FSL K6-0276 TaxID=2921450 RepID=UPI0030ED00A6
MGRYAANIMGMISLTGKIIIKISTTAIGFLSTALVSAVVIMLMDDHECSS